MSSPVWMPLYVSDYLADTSHLTTLEHGAYMLLIMAYWRNGGLPSDEAKLARICRMSARQWASGRDTLAAFFDTNWKHGRIEKELDRAADKSERRAQSGKRGGDAKSLKTKQAHVANATVLPEQNPSKPLASSSQSQSEREEGASHLNARASERGVMADFPEFWDANPNKIGKADAEKKYRLARSKASHATLMAGLRRYIANKPPDRQWVNPSTWLHQERWTDEPASSHQDRTGLSAAFDKLDARIAGREGAAPRHDGPELDLAVSGRLPSFAGRLG